MTTTKAQILAVDVVDRDATTVTASSSEGDFVAANVKTKDPGDVWRATGNNGETLTFDFGEDVDISHVAIIGHNANITGKVRIEIATDEAFSTVVYDSEAVDLWPPAYGFGEGGFGNHFGGYVDIGELGVFLPFRVIAVGAVYSKRYMRLTLTDTGSAGPDRLEAGKVMAGVADTFERNFARGWRWQEVDPSEQSRTDGGSMKIRELPIFPRLTVTFPNLSRSEAITKFRTIKRTNGRKRPVILMLFPDASPSVFYRTSIYGIVTDYGEETHRLHDRATQSITIDGLIGG